jgi:hypothetical protein
MPEKDKMIIYITKQKETFPKLTIVEVRVRVMVFNGTFNNFSIISWWRKPEYPEKSNHLVKMDINEQESYETIFIVFKFHITVIDLL